ncbi:MAG: EamA family transporter [Planctomycetaceae bacterium]
MSSPYSSPAISQVTADQQPHRDLATTWWPDASLLGVALIWGVNIPIMKIGLEHVDVYVFNAIRLIISSIVLAALALRERQQGIRPTASITRRRIIVYAMIVSATYQFLFLLGIARTTSGNTALIIATVPMWTALLARIFLSETLRRLAWTGLTIALAGTIIVALQNRNVSAGGEHLVGNLCVLGAALSWAAGTVYSRPMLHGISPMQLSASAAVIALPLHVLFAAGRYADAMPTLQSVNLWLIIVYSGVLSTGLALPMWNFGVRHAGAAHASAIQNLIPLIAIVAAWLSRGESVTTPQLIGGTLILSGLVIMRWSRQRAAAIALTTSERDTSMPVFDFRFTVDADVSDVSEFHFQPGILKTLTPPFLIMQVHRFEPLAEGSIAEFTMWMGPIPVRWKAVHSHVSPTSFTDTQVSGPMKSWVHTHTFREIAPNRTEVHEHIEFSHYSGWRGLWSRLLFPRPALVMLFTIRSWITRRHV